MPAQMAELVDAHGSGPCAARCGGSSPLLGTIFERCDKMTVTLHKNDLPADLSFKESVAIDTEAMGLKTERDRLCLVQLSSGDGTAHLIQFDKGCYDAPNLKKLLLDENVTKLFHFARFDVAILKAYLGVECTPIYCTKIASRLCRTYTDRHGLKDLTRHLLDVNLDKQQQTSDWGRKS